MPPSSRFMPGAATVSLVLGLLAAAGACGATPLDETGAPIPGFTLADADRIHTANDIDRRVSWRGQVSIASLAGQPMRVHVLLRDADLYTFQFRPSLTR